MGYFSEVEQELRERAFELNHLADEQLIPQLMTEFNLTQDEVEQSLFGDYDEPDCDDGDDGEALASIGWGTDEDYGSAEDML